MRESRVSEATNSAAEEAIVRSPYDGAEVGRVPVAGEADIEQAIVAAEQAFDTMRRLPRYARADILERAADIIERELDAFVRLIAAEAGKPLYDARGEVSRSLFNLRNAAAEARSFSGHEVPLDVDGNVFEYQTADTDGGAADFSRIDVDKMARLSRRLGLARRFPIGPILAITPFNFPLNLVLHKVAPALAVGNTVMLKPAPQTPLTAHKLAEAFAEAGLPDGALNVVNCSIPLSEAMVRDDRLKMVTFTGSAKVGWHIKDLAGKKKVALELGGNGAVVVAADADLDYAAARCIRGGVVYGGQYCIGVQRIFVHEDVYEPFRDRLLRGLKNARIGNPLEEGTDVGPVIDAGAAERIETWINEAQSAGATVTFGGQRNGTLIEPTLLENTRPGMQVEDEEIFGPVMTLTRVRDTADGIARANDTRYGLQAGLFTNDLRAALSALEDWDVGALMVNDVPIYRVDNMPFGGWRDSGFGREGTRYAMESMTDIKFLVVNYG